jgi:hypothetical protein
MVQVETQKLAWTAHTAMPGKAHPWVGVPTHHACMSRTVTVPRRRHIEERTQRKNITASWIIRRRLAFLPPRANPSSFCFLTYVCTPATSRRAAVRPASEKRYKGLKSHMPEGFARFGKGFRKP